MNKSADTAASDFEKICSDLAKLLQWSHHDGLYDNKKEVWEQDIEEFKDLWLRMTNPRYLKIITAQIESTGYPEWKRILNEALKQAADRRNSE